MNEKGLYTFFFGKRHKVTLVHSPFYYKPKTPTTKKDGPDDKTIVAFVRQCDYDTIFDKEHWRCVERSSDTGKEIALQRLEKYKNVPLYGRDIKGLLQFKDNCWFNSLLMCLFFSDGGRRIMNRMRTHWIKSNLTTRGSLYHVFTYLMELSHYNKDIINRVDSNMILTMLHSYDPMIFEHPGHTGGSGILYSKKLLSFLGLEKGYLELRFIETKEGVYTEVDGVAKEYIVERDVTEYIERACGNSKDEPEMMAVFLNLEKPFLLPHEMGGMRLDSVYLSNYNRNVYQHAIAGITCDDKHYVYDGERARSDTNDTLKPFQWTKSQSSFAMTYDREKQVRYDFTKGIRVAFYVKK